MAQPLTSSKNADQTGSIVTLSEDLYKNEAVQEKIDYALKHLNEKRKSEEQLKLLAVVSVTRQVINGFRFVFTTKLVEEGTKKEALYRITHFEKHGKPENTEVTLEEVKSEEKK